ncbi:MAG: hypothetical protein IJ629_04065 [Clostridia bacterium]|nr:hypothetical protein [Clostridia bacterium]
MDSSVDLSVAIDVANRKIAELNMKIVEENNEDLEAELNKWLTIKEEIYKGNAEIIKRVINNEI